MDIVKNSHIGKLKFHFNFRNSLQQIEFLGFDNGENLLGSSNSTVDIILDYLNNPNIDLSKIKTSYSGTPYQKKIWSFLSKIPIATTITYGELAKLAGGSPRSAANALRHNPIPIVFPCHRVVAKSDIGGFAGHVNGEMITIKQKLLRLEGVKDV